MVTVVGKTAEGLGVYRGLSTDLPLDPAPKNGSRFFAMDNGKTYWYDAASDTWEGYSGGGGGGSLPTGAAVFMEEVTISDSTNDTYQKKLNNLALAVVNYFASLGDDEFLAQSNFMRAGVNYAPTSANKIYTNASTSFSIRVTRTIVNAADVEIQEYNCVGTLASCYARTAKFTIGSTTASTLTDNSATALNSTLSVMFFKYKEVS